MAQLLHLQKYQPTHLYFAYVEYALRGIFWDFGDIQ